MRSLWQADCSFPERESLRGQTSADVAVVGAGLTGVLTAYLLQQRGLNVVVLERNRVGEGETGGTTAKITAQHGLIYDKLINQYGDEIAWQYALANSRAISQYQTLIEELNIDCNFKRCPAYIYSRGDTEKLEKADAALGGIPSFMTDHTELPFKLRAHFAFGSGSFSSPFISQGISMNLKIYENTRSERLKTEPSTMTAVA